MGISLETISCPSSVIRYFAPDGSVAYEAPSTYRFTAWNSLYQCLLAGIGERYQLGAEAVGIDQDNDIATVTFADGATVDAELVVAADGFDSTIRRLLFGPVTPSYSGYVGWRGLVVESDLTQATFEQLADAISYCVIPDSHIVAYPIPAVDGSVSLGDRLVNYVWYRNVAAGDELDELLTSVDGRQASVSLHPGAVQDRFIDEMKQAAEALSPVMREAVQRTPQPFLQAVVDIESPAMVSGSVALLGDGAFSARPHAAAGTAKAAEDGWKLIEALDSHDTVASALEHWERGQLELGRQLVGRARSIGERSQIHNNWIPGDPELAFGLYAPGR